MAHEKTCSGTQTLLGWASASDSCDYQLTLFIDGQAITTAVTINGTTTDAQIAALLNANRTGNTTGTISVQTIGADLHITISGVVLPTGSTGEFSYTITGSGFPCPDFSSQLPILMTCTIIPAAKKKKKVLVAYASQRCPDEIFFKSDIQHPQVKYCNQMYNFYGTDEQGLFHYINSRSNINLRGTQNWWAVKINNPVIGYE